MALLRRTICEAAPCGTEGMRSVMQLENALDFDGDVAG